MQEAYLLEILDEPDVDLLEMRHELRDELLRKLDGLEDVKEVVEGKKWLMMGEVVNAAEVVVSPPGAAEDLNLDDLY